MPQIRISTPQIEGLFQGSKQLKFQVLLGREEMAELFQFLPLFSICIVSEPTSMEQAVVPHAEFLEQYGSYVEALKKGERIDEKPLRRYFSSAWTTQLDAVYAMPAGVRYLIKPIRPLVQLQGHHVFYSKLDQQFHPMVLSEESITWGIQFSYPQLAQHPKTAAIEKVGKGEEFPNTPLFAALTKWLRQFTIPTPFVVEGKRINAPIRIGKQCLEWIHNHPQLKEKKIEIFPLTPSG